MLSADKNKLITNRGLIELEWIFSNQECTQPNQNFDSMMIGHLYTASVLNQESNFVVFSWNERILLKFKYHLRKAKKQANKHVFGGQKGHYIHI